jgi:hypothetical protein
LDMVIICAKVSVLISLTRERSLLNQ